MMSTSTVQHGETSPLPPCKGAVRSVEAKAFGNAIVDSFVRTDLQWNIFSLGDPKQQTNEPVKGYEKKTHSAVLLCCINFCVFFLLHRFLCGFKNA